MARDRGTRDLKRAIKRLKKIRTVEMADLVMDVLDANANEIVTKAKGYAPADDGVLQGSIYTIPGRKDRYEISRTVGAYAFHAPFIEFGTGHQVRVPAEFTTIASEIKNNYPKGGTYRQGLKRVIKWAKKKGMTAKDGAAIFAYIMRNGVSPQPFLYPALFSQRSQLAQDLRNIFKKTRFK